MSLPNEELVRKAIITTDAIAATGKLNPAQADKFIDFVIDVTGLKNNARVVKFRNEQMDIDKIGVSKRAAMPAVEAQDPGVRRGVNTSKVTLLPKEVIIPFEVSDSFLENNLEGEIAEDHIIKMMATQAGNDLEEQYINADLLGAAVLQGDIIDGGSSTQYVKDSFLAMFDGWLRLGDSANVVDFAGQNIGSNVFSRMMNSLPAKFKKNRGNLRFITSIELDQLYREKVASRATVKGDTALETTAPLTPFGVPLMPFALFPFQGKKVEHVTLTGTTPAQLRYAPISDPIVVTLATLGSTPTTPFIETTDYVLNRATGTIARNGAGGITSGALVKVTYLANPEVLLTHFQNLIVGIGRDVRIEKDRDIFKRVNQYAITMKVAVQIEELTALVKAKNVGTGV